MADIGEPVAAAITRLGGYLPLAALVGTRVGVFGEHTADAAHGYPYVTVQQISGDDESHLGGAADKADARLQINSVGTTYASAQSARRAAMAAWRTLTVPASISITGATVDIRSARITNQTDAPASPSAGRDRPRYVLTFDLEIWYSTS